ncbi:hypothetical protein PC115_g23715, partial [Phytophthora cactorum]
DNEKTTEDVFKLLRLNTDKGGEILKKPVLTTWFKYVGMSGQDANQLLLLKLKMEFSDEDLAKVLVAAGRDTNVQIEVWDMILAQHRCWRGRKKTAEDVFNLLKLNNEGEQLFKSRILDVWVSYVVELDKKNADEEILQ